MKRISLLPLLALCGSVVHGCSGSEDAPTPVKAPEPTTYISNAVVNPRASWTTVDQRETVVIAASTLTFPAKGNDDLLKKVAGDIIVSDRSAKGNNPDGFMRKVVSVAKQGDQIVVTTEMAYLSEVLHGQFQIVAHPEDLRLMTAEELGPQAAYYDVAPPRGPGLSPLDENKSSNTLNAKKDDIKLFSFETKGIKVNAGGHDFEIKGSFEGKLKEASFDFNPTISMGADLAGPLDFLSGDNLLQEFHLIAKGDLSTKLELAGEGKITTEKGATLPPAVQKGMADLAAKINYRVKEEGEKDTEQNGLFLTVTIASQTFVGPPIPTPIPIPTTFNLKVELKCSASASGGLEASIGFNAHASAEAGVRYTAQGGWSPVNSMDFGLTKIGPNYTANGAIGVECSLTPKLVFKIAGLAGPFVGIGGKVGLEGSYKEECEPGKKGLPKAALQASIKAGVEVSVGAEAKISVLSKEIDLGEASFTLYKKEWPIWESEKHEVSEDWVLGYCYGEEEAGGAGGEGGAAGTGGSGGSGGTTGKCGDGTRDPAEDCDGNDFGGKTCQTQINDNATGSLTCKSDCSIDTSTCTIAATCGDVCTYQDAPQRADCGACQKTVCESGQEGAYCCIAAWGPSCIQLAHDLCKLCY